MTKRGQAVTEVGRNQDRISAATEDVFIHSGQFGSSFKHLVRTLAEALLMLSVLLFCTLSLYFTAGALRSLLLPHKLTHVNSVTW